MKDIFSQVRDERADFLNNEVEVVPGYNFSQYNTIKKAHLYYNSHYEKGDYEEVNGVMRKKIFHNLSRWRCEVATKMIDMDIRDFILVSNKVDTDWNVFLLEKELKVWLKKNKMGQILNEISRLLPVYGSVVLYKTKEGAQVEDLRNFYVDQSTDTLENARFILKRMLLSHQDMRKMAKFGWENVNEAIDKFSGKYNTGYDLQGVSTQNQGSRLFYDGAGTKQVLKATPAPIVEVFERYGEVPLSWFTDKESDENEYVLAKYCVAGVDSSVTNTEGITISEEGIVLYKEQIDEIPFKEVHYSKTEGRWLGVGIVEILFENQRVINQLKQAEALGHELGSIQLFQSRDDTVAQNITTDLQSGEILKVKSEITPIVTEMRNSVGLQNSMAKIEEHSDALTFSRDVISGENAPASATLGAVQIQTQQTTAVFDYKKENIGLFLGEYIKDLVFPQIEKELNRAHVLRLVGTMAELQKLRKNYATRYANNKIIGKAIERDLPDPSSPDSEQVLQALLDMYYQEGLKEISLHGDKIWTDIQEKFFKDLDYEVDIVSTGENKNIYSQINNGSALLMALAKDPTMTTDPTKKKILFKVMSAMGWHMSELEDMESDALQAQNELQQLQGQVQPGQGGQSGSNALASTAGQQGQTAPVAV